MRLSLIAAMDLNRLIGKSGTEFGLPWDLPDDRQFFKDMTVGKPLIEGRKTYEATHRLLPDRSTIIVTRATNYELPGALIAHSIDEAILLGTQEAKRLGVDEIMVSGGGQIFAGLIDRADRIYLTFVDGVFEGDAYFPKFDASEWREVSRRHHSIDERHEYSFDIVTLERVAR